MINSEQRDVTEGGDYPFDVLVGDEVIGVAYDDWSYDQLVDLALYWYLPIKELPDEMPFPHYSQDVTPAPESCLLDHPEKGSRTVCPDL